MGSIIDKYGTSNPNYKSTSPSKGAAPSRNMTIVEKYGTSNPYYVAPNTSTTNADDIAPVGTTTKKFTMSNLGNNGLGGTFLGGWKQPEAKEKKTPAAAEIAAQQKEAGEAAKRLSYLETLDLSAQQKKIDALTAESKKGAKLNVHAFGGYDPKNLTETEMALAEAQEDYNLAKSLQYSAKGKEALEALDSETYAHIDNMALWKVSASKFRKKTGKDNVSEDLQALYDAGLTLADIEQLVDYRKRQINADVYDERVEKMQELASRDDLLGISDMGAVAASILSVPLNLGSGAGYLDLLNQKAYIEGAGYDRPLDYKTGAMSLYGQASAARETVSQGIVDNAKTELGGQVSSFLYQTGMSMADSAVVAGLGVLGLGASGTLLLGGSAATAAAVDAKNRGGSDSQALWSGALAGAAETVFEKVSIDNLLTGKYTKNFVGSEFKKLLADLGVQGAVEGSEELFTEFANHITDRAIMGGSSRYHESIRKYMAEGMTEAEAKAKADADFAVECAASFVGGLLSGGVMGGVANAARPTVGSYTTQITENDQKVIDKLVENSIAEAEKDGKKLTDKEKAKLRDKVMESVERGEVSFDTIAEVLDKEGYDAFKKLAAEEQKAIEELAELYEGDEFQQEATKFLENAESRSARAELDKKVFGMVKDGKLAESYMERGRRSQAYTADLTKYDEKQRATIQNAINSGVLNDTRRTHEFVDLIAKIAADKGIVFDFTNNEKLKGSMFAVEGKTVNGYVTKDGVTLNIDSAKALNSVVGHEITHVLEGTELYGDLQKILFEYAKSRKASNSKFDNEYSERLYNARQLYKDVDGYQGVQGFEKIKQEVVADLVGDYLFTDSDFVNNLVKHKNLFQMIWDEIKYLCNIAKSGSKEEDLLLDVKRAFEKAYRDNGKAQSEMEQTDEGNVWSAIVGTKKATEGGGTKYSLSQQGGTKQTRITQHMTDEERTNILASKSIKAPVYEGQADDAIEVNKEDLESQQRGLVKAALLRIGEEFGVFTDYKIPDVQVEIALSRGNLKESVSKDVSPVQLAKLLPVLKETVENAVGVESHANRYYYDNSTVFFDNLVGGYFEEDYFVPIRFGLKHSKAGNVTLYVIVDQNKIEAKKIKAEVVKTPGAQGARPDVSRSAYEVNLSQIAPLVNSEDLLRYLPDGMLNENQKKVKWKAIAETVKRTNDKNDKHYKDFLASGNIDAASQMVAAAAAAAGYTIEAYHGTKDQFTVFERGQENQYDSGYLGSGFYFTDNKETAENYSQWKKGNEKDAQVIGVVLRMKNPLVVNGGSEPHLIAVQKALGLQMTDFEDYLARPNKWISDAITKEAQKQGYDGIIRYSDNYGEYTYVVFDSNQVKSADTVTYDDNGNIVPLSERFNVENEDIRYSLSEQNAEHPVYGDYNVYGGDVAIAPETVAENAMVEDVAPVVEEVTPTLDDQRIASLTDADAPPLRKAQPTANESESKKSPRKTLHQGIIENIKASFEEKGFDFDKVLKTAKNLSTFSTVDNTPQRVMEKALGYKEGQILSDITVNKVAQNETEGIKWLNSFTDRKNGLLAQISKQYNIKPGSKESAAAQMYAEGFYVDENNDIIAYGDAELAKDFPDAKVQANIKGLAGDQRIRQIYDDTLAAINESRARNAYPEIPRLDNYFLHFRAMDDTFSRLGLPFNPNDIRAKDLPTDLNGVTADLKPGQPYFASAMHRTGKRTSFDLLGGLERYLSSAKNQIYHIDDIQTLRALRNYIADTYGQAHGLEGLDALSEEETQERIKEVYGAHLSTFAKFLNEEANVLAGKTALIDRGLEGIIGRRGMTFLNELNKQVGSNMVGYNLSSSLTNFIPVAQTFAKGNKAAFVKAFAQTVAHKVSGRSDGFAENSPVMIRRHGADRFYRTAWQKVADPGYALMSAVDNISTELIARTKYNELVGKGMDAQTAHYETDKWVSRLMGDRSLGQMPQLYNSKMLGLITKFQLEVRNQLDSQFYDTIQETKVSNEHIQSELERNAKTAAKVASTFVQLAVVQHLFGKAFEAVAGYNPALDIIEVLLTAFGFDDDEESEDTVGDNIEQGFLALLEDLPYTSTLTGGRIPIASALPIEELVKGEDEYGNEKSRWETLGEVAPYYLLPGGYGQIKKTYKGLDMFSDDHPIAGSYTDSGNLRFSVEDTVGNRIKAGIFGQYASKNAREYFDNNLSPLKEKQIQELIEVDLPISEYWAYRKGLAKQETVDEKLAYIDSLDLPISKKNILANNAVKRKNPIDMADYK